MNILDLKNLKEILHSILFVAGDGIEKSFIAEKLDISKKDLDKALEELKKDLSGDAGVHLIEYKDKVQLATNPNYASYISDVLNPIREKSLTRAALETLAIIAYKQPITKLDIEDIRGVNSDYAVQILIDQNMIEVVGRKDAVGKPLLFGTTENFLKRFDISKGKLSIYGIFLGLTEKDIFSISILTVRYIFMYWCLISANVEIIHLTLLILSGLIYSIINKRFFHILFDILSSFLLYLALLSKNIFFEYLTTILFEWKVLAIFILLVIFIILYSSYFFLKDIDYVCKNNKFVRKKYEK